MSIEVKDVTLKDLVKMAHAQGIARVLLADYASVEPVRENGSIVLMPTIRVVATALNREKTGASVDIIYRWQEQKPTKKMVTITAGTGRGRNPDSAIARRKEEIYQILREDGFEVDEGEWTPESVQAFLIARKRNFG